MRKFKKLLRPALFTLAGALAALLYHRFVPCPTGSCPISSSPVSSALYMGLIGYLISGFFDKEDSECNM